MYISATRFSLDSLLYITRTLVLQPGESTSYCLPEFSCELKAASMLRHLDDGQVWSLSGRGDVGGGGASDGSEAAAASAEAETEAALRQSAKLQLRALKHHALLMDVQ